LLHTLMYLWSIWHLHLGQLSSALIVCHSEVCLDAFFFLLSVLREGLADPYGIIFDELNWRYILWMEGLAKGLGVIQPASADLVLSAITSFVLLRSCGQYNYRLVFRSFVIKHRSMAIRTLQSSFWSTTMYSHVIPSGNYHVLPPKTVPLRWGVALAYKYAGYQKL
jgi:hypothetical protein